MVRRWTLRDARSRQVSYEGVSRRQRGDFLRDCCFQGEKQKVSAAELLQRYKEFTGSDFTPHAMAAEMSARGFSKKSVRIDGRVVQGYEGIALKRIEQCAFQTDPKE